MGKNIYAKLAVVNIKKNKEINLPYIAAVVIITVMYYLVVAMLSNEGLKDIPATASLKQCFEIANNFIIVITFIFMVYINSFLIKKRLREFGLYHVLGLEKKHIIYVMLIENILIYGGAVLAGMLVGTVLGKLCFLALLKICHTTTDSTFIISALPYLSTMLLFAVIFIFCFIMNIVIILKNKTIDLLHREKYGEKKVKGRGVLTVIGLILLIGAYYKANTIQNYIQAISVFFPAVLAVIVATYLLFMSGSIVLLNVLKKNKGFYYKAENFISTSSLIYRMRHNAVGLANICILSTMVIVTAAGCVSLYMGQETIVKERNPYDLTILDQADIFPKEDVLKLAEEYGLTVTDYIEFQAIEGYFVFQQDSVANVEALASLDQIDEKLLYNFVAMSQEEYNRLGQTKINIEENHVVLISNEDISGFSQGIKAGDRWYEVDDILTDSILFDGKYGEISQTIYFVFATEAEAVDFSNYIYTNPYDETGMQSVQHINYEGEENDRISFGAAIIDSAEFKSLVSNIDASRTDAYSIYGGILFIGIFFILIFLTITILIIYFKQVTEGYDDRERFVILQKVGMDEFMVKKAINRQIIIVFYLPLITALIHLIAASNIIKSMMSAFYLADYGLIFRCITATSAAFAVIYIIVYKMTARTYYKIIKF
ncbi:ABC transporter permease [Konateibacter massiliensis]|uniref:ABC transporter permease n=1 Tax=Konateibacter massiliensis TaxID=2002841 RepID=UPI000C14D9E9|nr:ABC transporter permease [Konateibacter massiliensis]